MAPTHDDDLLAAVDHAASSIEGDLIAVRRHLHTHPELSWHEYQTQRYLREQLEARGLEPISAATTGLYVDIGDPGVAPVVYRADIDALPIQDAKDAASVPYTSKTPGVCHACGHDVHATIGLGVASVLQQLRDRLPGRVRVVFQPAEETLPSGAEAIAKEGVLRGSRAALALHVDPARDVGTVGTRVGPLTSSTDVFTVDVIGASGHSARPYLAKDAVLAAPDVVRALYSLVPQEVDPLEPAVLAVGTIRGGEAKNVIAERVRLQGTVRSMNPDVRELLARRIPEVADLAARVHGCRAEVHIDPGAPPVMNDAHLERIVRQMAGAVLGDDAVGWVEKASTGAEDFGVFGRFSPIFMLRLGVRPPGADTHHLHTPLFDVDERALGLGVRIMTRSVLATLGDPPAGAES